MDIEKYLNMNTEELYSFLISDIMRDPTDGNAILLELSETDRYRSDYEFRTSIETAKCILISMKGNAKETISVASNLIDTATALHMWQLVATNWNLLGIAYAHIGISEKAVECYHNAIKVEQSHHLVAISSIAYNNIAMVYAAFEIHEKAREYFQRAINTLKAGDPNQPRFKAKLVLYISNLITTYCRMEQSEPVPELLEKIEKLGIDDVNTDIKSAYHFASMHYYFCIKDFKNAREAFLLTKATTHPDNFAVLFSVIANYFVWCKKSGLGYDFYEDEILFVSSLHSSNRALANAQAYQTLREYYEFKKDWENYDIVNKKYVQFLEEDAEVNRTRQNESLMIMDDIIQKRENLNDMISKNTELSLVAEEAIRHKNSLQKAYHQIELINQLGKKITSSLHLNEVIELIYQNISENIPMTIFILMTVHTNSGIMKSLTFYKNGVLQPEFSIRLNDSHSFFVECYKKNQIISTDDIAYFNFFTKQKLHRPYTKTDSAIYLPLNINGKTIGICSIQNNTSNAYTDENKKFLEELLPYLSISLNNAIHSETLEKEIQSHLETQKELQNANKRLEKLSSLDGLTEISSRRDFDTKFIKMILESQAKQQSVSIIMVDIDNFKLYNDHYGHLEGDEVLKKVANVFQKNLQKKRGLSARFGGEEFIGACLGLTFEENFSLAEKIRSDIFDQNIPHEVSPLKQLSVSIGVVVSDGLSVEEKSVIMKQADQCLYDAKEKGKNKVVIKTYKAL